MARRRAARLGPGDGEDAPRAGHALQLVFAPVVELEARPHQQVLDRAGHEHLARARQGRHPRRDVYGEPSHPLAAYLDFARVHTGADLKVEWNEGLADRPCATDGPAGSV